MGKILLIIENDTLLQIISLFIALATFIIARAIEKKEIGGSLTGIPIKNSNWHPLIYSALRLRIWI